MHETLERLHLEDDSEHLRRLKKDLHVMNDWCRFLDQYHSARFPASYLPGSESRCEFHGLRFFWKPRKYADGSETEEDP